MSQAESTRRVVNVKAETVMREWGRDPNTFSMAGRLAQDDEDSEDAMDRVVDVSPSAREYRMFARQEASDRTLLAAGYTP